MVHSVVGGVEPAQDLTVIVPDDSGLEVEVTILDKGIGFVEEDQEVTIKPEAFPLHPLRYTPWESHHGLARCCAGRERHDPEVQWTCEMQ